MTSPTVAGIDLMELAERVEAATAYDGRLMAEIDCAVRFPHLRPAEPDDHPTVKDHRFDASAIWTPTGWLMSRNYYGSLDDAMSLADDMLLVAMSDIAADGLPGVCLCSDTSTSPPKEHWGIATTSGTRRSQLARAFTAAALRARASLIEEGRS